MPHQLRTLGSLGLLGLLGIGLAVASASAAPPRVRHEPAPEQAGEPSDDDEALLEFHFNPVENL